MGRRRTPGLEWLDPEDRKQRQWAVNYLWVRDYLPDSKGPRRFIKDEEIQEIGGEMERGPKGREVLRLMKEAWRQKRRKDTNGSIQTCTFTLKTTTKANLKKIADSQNTNATALLESLIDKAYKAHHARETKKRPRRLIPLDASKTKTGSAPDTVRRFSLSGNIIPQNHSASLASSESANSASSNSVDRSAPTTITKPPQPDSSHEFEMPGKVLDIPTPEEIALLHHRTKILAKAHFTERTKQSAPTTSTKPPQPDSSHEFEMPGKVLDIPAPEEIELQQHRLEKAVRNMLARKNAQIEAGESFAAKADAPNIDPHNPASEADPDSN